MHPARELKTADGDLDLDRGYDVPIAARGPIDHTAALEVSRALCGAFARMHPEADEMVDPFVVLQTFIKRNHEQLDRARLKRLGESVFAEGGEQVLKMVDDVLAGRRLKI